MVENGINGAAGSDSVIGAGAVKPASGNTGAPAKDSGGAGKPIGVNIGQARTGNGKFAGSGTGEKRGRGRPPGSGTKTDSGSEETVKAVPLKPSKPVDVDGLTLALQNTCAILAGIAKCPELDLDDDEAKQVAAAYANVARHYNFTVNEKAADWYNLMTVAGAVFGSKFIAIRMRKKDEAKRATPQPVFTQPQRVTPTPSAQATPAPVQEAIKPLPKTPLQPPPVQSMPAAEPDYSQEEIG